MESIKVFVHIKLDEEWDNFKWDFNYIPHKYDQFSLSVNGPIYEVDYTLFNYFDCDYKVEVYAHEIN